MSENIMADMVQQQTWGVIRYAPGSGSFPDDDAAGFDGWYTDRADAFAVARDWVAQYPQWIIGLVRSDLIWFGNGDFSACRRPLTKREARFHRSGEANSNA